MEVYHRQSVSHITTVAVYEDGSVKQMCFDPNTREVQLYRSCPDVVDGLRFMRAAKFVFDFKDLAAVINTLLLLKDRDEPLVEVAVKQTKRLVFLFNEQFGNWEMGFQKKKAIQKQKAVIVDLDNEDLEENPTRSNLRVEVLKPDYDEQLLHFESIKKHEDFEVLVDRMNEFQRDVLDSYPHLRVDDTRIFPESDGMDERFFKRHIELFKYLTFQLNYDKEDRSVSRISIIRQYSNDLKAVDDNFDPDYFVRNEKVHELCRILKATRSTARGVADQQSQSQSSRGSSSTVTSAGGIYNRAPPTKKKKLKKNKYFLRRL